MRIKRLSSKQEIGGSSPPKTSHFNLTLSSDQRGKRIQKQTKGTPEQKDHLKTTVIKVLWLSGQSACLVNRSSVVRVRPRPFILIRLCQVTNEEKEYKNERKEHRSKMIT